MPTGYTYQLIEAKKPLSLRQFTLICARAFGACVGMREDDISIPAPQVVEVSSYHVDALKKARRELKRLAKMTKPQIRAFNKAEHKRVIKSYENSRDASLREQERLLQMRTQVEDWAPNSEVANLKIFMLDQIEVSVQGDSMVTYYEGLLRSIKQEDHHDAALQKAHRDIEYHTKEQAAEQQRADASNAWLKALHDSLPTI